MGTSTDYSGAPNWGAAKGEATRTAGGGHTTPQKAANVVANFVGEMRRSRRFGFGDPLSREPRFADGRRGGSGGKGGGVSGGGGRTGRANSARTIAQGLGSFLSDVQRTGFKEALAVRGLVGLEGRSAEEVAIAIADALGGPASLIDETALRSALIDLLMEWCNGEDLEGLSERVTAESGNIEVALFRFLANYIFEVFKTIGAQNVIKTHGPDRAEAMSTQIKEFISAKLETVEYEKQISTVDWTGMEGARIIDEIVNHTIDVFSEEP